MLNPLCGLLKGGGLNCRYFLKERIFVKDINHKLSTPFLGSSSYQMANFSVNDISWAVWIDNRINLGLGCKGNGREKLVVYATMNGRERLQNYELVIERIQDDQDAVVGGCPRLTESCKIVLSSDFKRRERFFFSVDVNKWLNARGELAFMFHVRPLTFEQKIKDLEIYYKKSQASHFSRPSDKGEVTEEELSDEDVFEFKFRPLKRAR